MWWILESLAVLAAAWGLGRLAKLARLPALLGMIAGGVLVANLISPTLPASTGFALSDMSPTIRLVVLAVVLLRAGLGLGLSDLRRTGAWALGFGLIPMLADATAVAAAGVWLLGLAWAPAFVLGFWVAAISPAIVIPGLMEILDRRSGQNRRLPQALLAGAPLDNIAAIVGLGLALDLALASGGDCTAALLHIPWSLGFGAAFGVGLGFLLAWLFNASKPHPRPDTGLLWLTACCLIPACQAVDASVVIAVLVMGVCLRARLAPERSAQLQAGLAKLWAVVQLALFGLIGYALDLGPLAGVGIWLLAVVGIGQAGRLIGSLAFASLLPLAFGQRLASYLAYMPKATIQAAFAGLALDRGLAEGALILSAGVLAVVILAPLGSLALSRGAERLLPS
jgi:NhaP-type Na+/H+ or K+/H+ antiporter